MYIAYRVCMTGASNTVKGEAVRRRDGDDSIWLRSMKGSWLPSMYRTWL